MHQKISYTPLAIPEPLTDALENGAALAISISGGKDSQVLLKRLVEHHRLNGYPGPLFALHADLGRAEWGETPFEVRRQAELYDVPLVTVQRPKGDLVQRIEERLLATRPKPDATEDEAPAPFWPSASSRYCTSHLKSGPIDTALRNPEQYWPSASTRYCTSDLKRGPLDTALREYTGVVISAEGVRAGESAARAGKPALELRTAITSAALLRESLTPEGAYSNFNGGMGTRLAFNWRPLLRFTEDDIWQALGHTRAELEYRRRLYKAGLVDQALEGWQFHPAYVYGNERLSCALCVLGSKSDLLNGANHNPDLYGHYLELEIIGGATFKHGWSLAELPVVGRAAELKEQILAAAPAPKAGTQFKLL
jgi:3'-phosphoadenosine 5'-phosphosulfate sulfotransferase (PAPS reductase)/FAD synthetase